MDSYKSIDISDFVPYAEIDPIHFAKTYYVGPQEGAERVYSLLVRAMESSELAAIAKFIMRDKQHLGALRVREGVITLEQLYYADEVRPIDEIQAAQVDVDARELEMAERLIESFTGDWEPERYRDTYRDELCAIIRAKRKGKEVHAAARVEDEGPPDLMAALRASLEQVQRGRASRRPPARARAGARDDLRNLSKAELEERAKRAKIAGRSKMTKDELVEALEHAA